MRTVYACSLRFADTHAIDAIWAEVASWVSGWYARNAPEVQLPKDWAGGGAGQLTPTIGHALEATILTLEGGGGGGHLRELHWRYPDASDSSLVWSADVAVHVGDGTIFTLVLKIASVDYELLPARFQLGTPRVVRRLVGRGDAHIAEHRIALNAERVEPDAVEALVDLLLAKTRRHPVIVVSTEPYSDRWIVDPAAIANAVAGLASVQALSSRWAGFALTDEVGKKYSCYNGAIRIYWPRFSLEDDPFFHRLWLPAEMSGPGGSEATGKSLLRVVAAAASFRFVEPEPLRSFRIRHDEARLAALKASKGGDYEALFNEYVKLDTDARQLREQLEEATRDNETLRENLSAAWSAPPEDTAPTSKVPTADDHPDLSTVHEAVLEAQRRTTHLIYLDEAISSARESPFKQPNKAYSALIAIDDVARRWAEQLTGGPKVGPRKEAFRQRGFEYKEDISQTSGGRWGDEYSYVYDGRKTLFAPHITVGAKQVDKCLSVHMYWDEVKARVVIAHVGRHKTNTRS